MINKKIIKTVIFLIILSFCFTTTYSASLITTFMNDNIINQDVYTKDNKIWGVEYFTKTKEELVVAKYYVESFITSRLSKFNYKKISPTSVKLPHIKFKDLTPPKLSYYKYTELYYSVASYGDEETNYQLLSVFCRRFDNKSLIRMIEFKLYNKEHEKPTHIFGGVLLELNENNEIIIKKEF